MAKARIPLAQPIQSRTADPSKDARSVNVYFENQDEFKTINKRPGYTNRLTIATGQAQGLFEKNGNVLYAVINGQLYHIDSGYNTSNYGSVGTGEVTFNQTSSTVASDYVFLQDTASAYVVYPGETSVKKVTGGVYGVTVTAGGTGYVNGEAITFASPGGTGRTATGTTIVVGGALTGITMTDVGSEYASFPALIFTNGSGATYTGVLNGIPSSGLCTGVGYIDDVLYVLTTDSRIFGCDVGRPDLWNPLNYILVQEEPSPGVALTKHLNYIVALTKWSTEFFYDAGNAPPGSALLPNPSVRIEIGCASANSVCSDIEQTVVWIGDSKQYGKSVYLMDGLSPVKISTKYIEKYLNADANLSDAHGRSLKIAGHTFYVLTLKDLGYTFVYDLDQKEWYQWTSLVNGVQTYFQPQYYAKLNGLNLCLSNTDGTLNELDTGVYNDNGSAITIRIVTPNGDSGNTHYKFYRKVELIGDKTSSTWSVSHSANDYVSFSTARSIDGSKTRAMLTQLGSDRRRAWQFVTSSNVAIRIECAELDFDVGRMEGHGQNGA